MNRLERRLTAQLVIVPAIAAVMTTVYFSAASPDSHFRWSMATGYAGLVLLAVTLVIGPLNSLRRLPTPVSLDLRRDIGVWSGLITLWHVVLGLQSHFVGRMWKYFFSKLSVSVLELRHDLFGFANHTGLLATILILLLAVLSNDLSLRWLGAARWKEIQRSNYVLFALVVLHSLFYQILEKRIRPFVFALGIVAALVLGAQLARMIRRRKNRTEENAVFPFYP